MGVPLDAAAARERAPGSVRVFVVDSHELARQGLRDLLEGEGLEVVGDCWSAAEASRRIVEAGADVAVLDGALPDGTGIEICRYARTGCLGSALRLFQPLRCLPCGCPGSVGHSYTMLRQQAKTWWGRGIAGTSGTCPTPAKTEHHLMSTQTMTHTATADTAEAVTTPDLGWSRIRLRFNAKVGSEQIDILTPRYLGEA